MADQREVALNRLGQPLTLEEIRHRNELRKSYEREYCAAHRTGHTGSLITFPPGDESVYDDSCDHEDVATDIDTLLARIDDLSRHARPICDRCHYVFLHLSNYDRHPCPPPPDYDFSAP